MIKCCWLRLISFLVLYFSAPSFTRCQSAHFDYHDNLKEAYHLILQLKGQKAQHRLDSLKISDPHNYAIYHIENYIDFFTVFLEEEIEDLDLFKDRIKKRLILIDQVESTTPYKDFAKAEIILQLALARSKFGEHIRAGFDINRAHKLLKQNQKKYPNFQLNTKSLSIIHATMGSLKGFQKRIVELFTSLEGNYEQGVNEIKALYSKNDDTSFFSVEIKSIRALMSYHVEKNVIEAREIINDPLLDNLRSPLVLFLKSSFTKEDKEVAQIELLKEAIGIQKSIDFDYLYLLLGTTLLQAGDSSCHNYLDYFINNFKGRHYMKEAMQKKAWACLIFDGDEKKYLEWMARCKDNGFTQVGEDESAHKESLLMQVPNRDLLRVRLLSDGFYYTEALDILEKMDSTFLEDTDQLEYVYRYARVLQGLSKTKEAIGYFDSVINKGKDDNRYFACNAALQNGIIYQEINVSKSKEYLELCLNIKPGEHRNSLHQKARSWLQKLQ